MDYEAHVTGAPDYLLVLRKVRWSDNRMNQPLISLEVTSIGTIGSIAYPAAGRYQQAAYGQVAAREYEFNVIGVEVLTEEDRKNWFPEWPGGTLVRDQINRTSTTVPFSTAQMSELELERLKDSSMTGGVKLKRLALVVFNVALLATIGWILWKRRTRSQKSSP
jgi:hypothetical protein